MGQCLDGCQATTSELKNIPVLASLGLAWQQPFAAFPGLGCYPVRKFQDIDAFWTECIAAGMRPYTLRGSQETLCAWFSFYKQRCVVWCALTSRKRSDAAG